MSLEDVMCSFYSPGTVTVYTSVIKQLLYVQTPAHIYLPPTASIPILWKGFLFNKNHGKMEKCASNFFLKKHMDFLRYVRCLGSK